MKNSVKDIWKWKKTIIKFGDTKIKKQKFHQYKRPISIDNIDFDKIVVSKKVSFDKIELNISSATKILIKIGPLLIFLPKMSTYRRDFDNTKCMTFL